MSSSRKSARNRAARRQLARRKSTPRKSTPRKSTHRKAARQRSAALRRLRKRIVNGRRRRPTQSPSTRRYSCGHSLPVGIPPDQDPLVAVFVKSGRVILHRTRGSVAGARRRACRADRCSSRTGGVQGSRWCVERRARRQLRSRLMDRLAEQISDRCALCRAWAVVVIDLRR